MGGSGGGGSQYSTTIPNTLPPEVLQLLQLSYGGLKNIFRNISPASVMSYNPQQIPGMTSQEQNLLAAMEGNIDMNTGLTSQQQAEQAALQQFMGPLGSTPEYQTAMNVFQQQTLPQVFQAASLRGLGQGAAAEAAALASSQASVPLLQSEMQNQLASSQMLGNLGATGLSQQGQMFQTEDFPRQLAAQQAEANYQEMLRRAGMYMQGTLGPISAFYQGPGTTTYGTSSGGGK
jgi:hypothetical protein